MMLGVSGLMGSSGDGAAAAESGGGSSEVGASSSIPGGGSEEIERGGGGNRWPRQEALALLKIRSDMDVAFRDTALKGPLWEEVSRKMAELGYQRSAKKCKEKFENVYKYHRRTKDGRASKSDGKTYRFFDQLQALENTPPPRPPPPAAAAQAMPVNSASLPMPTDFSTSPNPLSAAPPIQTAQPPLQTVPVLPAAAINISNPSQTSKSTSSSSTSSDEDIQMRRGKKRKWKDFFHRLMKDVIDKQEELQQEFLDTLEKRERDRLAREEAWRVQEMARVNREHELLVQERSIAAAKDAAVVAFLQKVTGQNNLEIQISTTAPVPPQVPMQSQPPENPQPQTPQQAATLSSTPPPPKPVAGQSEVAGKADNGGDSCLISTSSSRWPKAEVQALINLRTSLDIKYQENGPKGPLWEEVSAAMAKLGYNRSSKRCKEKWENINKYYKKVKESNKKRPGDSKTCPYFPQLEAIYYERAKNDLPTFNPGFEVNPDNQMSPIMARPEQQWPLDHDNVRENNDHDDDEDEEDEGRVYEIVTNKQPSSATNAVK